MSFFASTSGAIDAGTTTQPTRIFTGSARAGVAPAAAAAPAAMPARLNWRRSIPLFTVFPPAFGPFVRWGLFIAAKACYRPPPTQKRAIESGERTFPLARRALSPWLGRIGPSGVGNGGFKRPTARSIYL